MRPRKWVVILDADEGRGSQMRYVVENWGYHAVRCGSIEDFSSTAAFVDVVIAVGPSWTEALRLVDTVSPSTRILLALSNISAAPLHFFADRTLYGASTEEIRDALRGLAARKRGPRSVGLPEAVGA